MGGQNWTLDNAERLNQEAPNSFFIPSKKQREQLKQGNLVKLVFLLGEPGDDSCAVERMWVEVIEVIEPGKYMGTLSNDPHSDVGLKYGDIIHFGSQHVAAKDFSEDELGYDAGMHAAVNKRVRTGDRPQRLIYVDDATGWYVFVGDENDQERGDGNNFEWWSLGYLTDVFPAMTEPFQSSGRGGYWDLSPDDGQYHWFSF